MNDYVYYLDYTAVIVIPTLSEASRNATYSRFRTHTVIAGKFLVWSLHKQDQNQDRNGDVAHIYKPAIYFSCRFLGGWTTSLDLFFSYWPMPAGK